MTVQELLEAQERSMGRPVELIEGTVLGGLPNPIDAPPITVILYRVVREGVPNPGDVMVETRWAVSTEEGQTVQTAGVVRTDYR